MTGPILILGYGPVGRATTARLAARGAPVVVVQRTAPKDLPAGVAFKPCDVLDAAAAAKRRRRSRAGGRRVRLSLRP